MAADDNIISVAKNVANGGLKKAFGFLMVILGGSLTIDWLQLVIQTYVQMNPAIVGMVLITIGVWAMRGK